jgi:PAS domain S-box-containing protein
LRSEFDWRKGIGRFGLAAILVTGAAAVRLAFHSMLGSRVPFLFFSLADVATARLFGFGPGLVAVGLGTCAAYFLFIRPAELAGGGSQAYVVGLSVVVDVTLVWMTDALHRSTEASRQSARDSEAAHSRLANLIARIGDSFLTFDRRWICLYGNEHAAAMAHRRAGDLRGKLFREILPEIFTADCEAALEQALSENTPVKFDGGSAAAGFWYELTAYPGKEEIAVFIRDVTQRMQALSAATEQEDYFRRIFDESPVGKVIVDMNGNYVRANRAFCTMVEYSEDELVGRSTNETIPAEDLETTGFFSPRLQVLVQGVTDSLQMEKRYISKTGRILLTNLNASIIHTADGQRQFLGIIENVTERKLIEEQLREAQKMESLGVLAGGVAHDFNNLLTSIMGNASLGLDLTPSDSPIRPMLQRLLQASNRAADLTGQLLAYAGKGRVELTAVDLSSAAEDAVEMLRAGLASHVRLTLDLSRTLPALEADPAQIRRVVANLVANAAEAIPEDRQGWVTVRTRVIRAGTVDAHGTLSGVHAHDRNYAVLEVEDNGIGMDAKTQARIFEPFFTTKFAGRGLGLSAVLGIVSSYKGAVRVTSEPEKGSIVRVLLPATASALAAGQ